MLKFAVGIKVECKGKGKVQGRVVDKLKLKLQMELKLQSRLKSKLTCKLELKVDVRVQVHVHVEVGRWIHPKSLIWHTFRYKKVFILSFFKNSMLFHHLFSAARLVSTKKSFLSRAQHRFLMWISWFFIDLTHFSVRKSVHFDDFHDFGGRYSEGKRFFIRIFIPIASTA